MPIFHAFLAFNSVLLTYLSPLAATGCWPPINCADTSGAPVTACTSAPPHQREGQQRVVILLSWLIVNRLDNREYYSLTTSWRGESRRTECLSCWSDIMIHILFSPIKIIMCNRSLMIFNYRGYSSHYLNWTTVYIRNYLSKK